MPEQPTSKERDFEQDLARLEDLRHSVGQPTHADGHFLVGFIDKLWNEYSKTLAQLDDEISARLTHESDTETAEEARWRKQVGLTHEPPAGRLAKCPFCNSPSKADGSIQHSAGCEGLEDSGYSKLQVHVLENTLVAAIDRATQPPLPDHSHEGETPVLVAELCPTCGRDMMEAQPPTGDPRYMALLAEAERVLRVPKRGFIANELASRIRIALTKGDEHG